MKALSCCRDRRNLTVPSDVFEVRRSTRIAQLTGGYANEQSDEEVQLRMEADAARKGKGVAIKDNGPLITAPNHEAIIIDAEAAAPPNLPLSTVQVIGATHCQMPSMMLSEVVLQYDNSNDSALSISPCPEQDYKLLSYP
jgi:hypothetical protein